MAVETLGEAWSLGWRIHVKCASEKGDGMKRRRECVYSAELDLDTLLMAKGPSFPLVRLGTRLWCPHCRETRMRVIFSPSADTDRRNAAASV
jgi:hypothetical protein